MFEIKSRISERMAAYLCVLSL